MIGLTLATTSDEIAQTLLALARRFMIERIKRSISFPQLRNIRFCLRHTYTPGVIVRTSLEVHRRCCSSYESNMGVSAEAALDFLSFVNASPTRMSPEGQSAILVFTRS